MDTDVKSAFTSQDMMLSSDLKWTPLMCCMKSLMFWTSYGDLPTRGFRILASSFDI